MRPFSLALPLVWAVSGCAMLNQGGADAGADGSAGAASSSSGGATATAQGGDCITEPTTGATLCSAISICPNVVVDHDVYPNCGFRIHGQALDVECACSGSLCSVGAPTSCDQAAKLLAAQTEQQVCTQLNEGRCTTPATQDAGTPSASGCDKTCASECAGDIGCIKMCGC